jgi:type VI secretion system protein ImpB
MTYMDGKDGAEALVGKLLSNPDLMKSLSAAPKASESES